jgi:hypothetical protein
VTRAAPSSRSSPPCCSRRACDQTAASTTSTSAHEGNASGGHAAIRFGAWSYDFQHEAGWITPRREDSRRFQHAYRTLQNRSIEVSRIAATPATVALLRDTFERRLLAQSRQLEVLEELRRDVALLEALGARGDAFVSVRGAGFFAARSDPAGDAPPALATLRRRIEERHGAGWLAGRRAAAQRALLEVSLVPLDVSTLAADPRYPVAGSRCRAASKRRLRRCRSDAIERPRPRGSVRVGDAARRSGVARPASRDRLRGRGGARRRGSRASRVAARLGEALRRRGASWRSTSRWRRAPSARRVA